ncbi:MAG: phosphoribosyl-ATP diphosphatase [Nitrospirae bacterium]|nr:phosphoribosyl-ATP diphosphatase [Nitrospirota bacterium]
MEKKVIEDLYHIVLDRKNNPLEQSYTCSLFYQGKDTILKKVSEEATEVILASKSMDKEATVYELADLFYHILVLMVEDGIEPSDVYKELRRRMNNKQGG